jgi:hypothetical protein
MNRPDAPRPPFPLLPSARVLAALALCGALAGGMGGCAVVSVAGAAAGAAISVTGAVVSTGVEVTGKVVGKAVDAVVDEE